MFCMDFLAWPLFGWSLFEQSSKSKFGKLSWSYTCSCITSQFYFCAFSLPDEFYSSIIVSRTRDITKGGKRSVHCRPDIRLVPAKLIDWVPVKVFQTDVIACNFIRNWAYKYRDLTSIIYDNDNAIAKNDTWFCWFFIRGWWLLRYIVGPLYGWAPSHHRQEYNCPGKSIAIYC